MTIRRTKCGVEIVRPAVKLKQILTLFGTNLDNFINTAALKRMKCWVEIVTPAVGLRQILTRFGTAGVRIKICGVKLVITAVGLRKILNFEINFYKYIGCKKDCMWGKKC